MWVIYALSIFYISDLGRPLPQLTSKNPTEPYQNFKLNFRLKLKQQNDVYQYHIQDTNFVKDKNNRTLLHVNGTYSYGKTDNYFLRVQYVAGKRGFYSKTLFTRFPAKVTTTTPTPPYDRITFEDELKKLLPIVIKPTDSLPTLQPLLKEIPANDSGISDRISSAAIASLAGG